ncbi:hypothetical protein L9F63_019043, partial [Diploptera punctata]
IYVSLTLPRTFKRSWNSITNLPKKAQLSFHHITSLKNLKQFGKTIIELCLTSLFYIIVSAFSTIMYYTATSLLLNQDLVLIPINSIQEIFPSKT